MPSWRGPGILGRLLAGPDAADSRRAPTRGETSIRSTPKTPTGDPHQPEPAGDAGLKRRIEQQIRDAMGDRLRSVEVRVTGRNVLIVARPSRFWQKRSIRRTLETLPALAGLRARIEITD
jgi:hypothetical protein